MAIIVSPKEILKTVCEYREIAKELISKNPIFQCCFYDMGAPKVLRKIFYCPNPCWYCILEIGEIISGIILQ